MSTIEIIPLIDTASQSKNILLGGQSCVLNVYQKSTGLFLDLAFGSQQIITGTLCWNEVFMVRNTYLGFYGDIMWMDAQGNNTPQYTGNGDLGPGGRFYLVYYSP